MATIDSVQARRMSAVQWALGPPAEDILEIGSGTGGLTRRLVGRHAHVRAVEPDARMRAVLRARVPDVEVVAVSAEQIPAADASFDAVIGASMWHWVDEARALPEVARVLRPGGSFSLLWGGTDRSVDWVRSLWAGGKELSGDEIDRMDTRRRARHVVHLGQDDPPLCRTGASSHPMDPVDDEGGSGGHGGDLQRHHHHAGRRARRVPVVDVSLSRDA